MLRLRAGARRALCAAAGRPAAAAGDVRVRFAPSPTGELHLGGLRTALFNYLFARSQGGTFCLRIEDTDQSRTVPGAADALCEALRWAGLEPDEGPQQGGPHGPYTQSQRDYSGAVAELLDRGHAYRCFCSAERLAVLRRQQAAAGQPTVYDRACLAVPAAEAEARAAAGEPHTVRLKVPAGATTVRDLVRGHVRFAHAAVDDQVLLKSDGLPTYHLANVVDDHAMRISHVIRGEEWLPSTPKHLLLYAALEWTPPEFAHLPLLLNADRSKLSKRQGDVSVDSFRRRGFLPEALLNFCALLGWNPGAASTQEVFADAAELAAAFSLAGVNKGGSVVDMERLEWINSRHVRAAAADDARRPALAELARPFVEEALGAPLDTAAGPEARARLELGVWLARDKVRNTSQFGPLVAPLLAAPDVPRAAFSDAERALLAAAADALEALPQELPGAPKALKAVAKAAGAKPRDVLLAVRRAVTGLDVGASLGGVLEAVGREEVLGRLRAVC